MKIKYIEKAFQKKSLDLISKINTVISEYACAGYQLTLRQCYYQLVSRGYIENSKKSYSRISDLVSDGRLAGLIDWATIEDRTRNLAGGSWGYEGVEDFLNDTFAELDSKGYCLDKWENQPNYIEVWVEKDALSDIVGRACNRLDVAYFSCRGYASQTALWQAAQRFIKKSSQDCFLLYLGDHDPSGIDMTRDIQDRLNLFGANVNIRRLALNIDQIEKFDPPPNYAKETDNRFKTYIDKFGGTCWELDALKPQVIFDIITDCVVSLRDNDLYAQVLKQEEYDKAYLDNVFSNLKEKL